MADKQDPKTSNAPNIPPQPPPKRISKAEANQRADELAQEAEASLPPPGYAREEELLRRRDELERLAEQAARYAFAVDPAVLSEDREIAHGLHGGLTDLQPGYVYLLACTRSDAQEVWASKTVGWELVRGRPRRDCPKCRGKGAVNCCGDPEALSLIDENNHRRIGDAVLMRMNEKAYVGLVQRRTRRNLRRERSVSADVLEMGEKVASKTGGKVQLVDNPFSRPMKGGRTTLGNMMHNSASAQHGHAGKQYPSLKEQLLHQQATDALDQMIRDGSVPGVPTPGESSPQ